MWGFASNALAGCFGPKTHHRRTVQPDPDCSDDEVSGLSREEGLDCPICFESFNIVENVPYVLWCGHTLCKNCVLGLKRAVVKVPTLPIQLPLIISCPWCHLLSFRITYKGILKFPRKNFFLLWMVESMNGDRRKSNTSSCTARCSTWFSRTGVSQKNSHHHSPRIAGQSHQTQTDIRSDHLNAVTNYVNQEQIQTSAHKLFAFFANLTTKFPLVIISLLIVLYAIPASAILLTFYVLLTLLFALPSFVILYFAYPSLDWLVREILM